VNSPGLGIDRWFDIMTNRNQNRNVAAGWNSTTGGGESRTGMHHFVKESRLAAAPGLVFAFHESPGALEKLIPPWEKVTVIESPGSLAPGNRAVLRTKVGPFTVPWVAEHMEYEQGRMFADRQVRGPFAYWYHRHLCLDDGEGGTLLRDEVDYRPPLGLVGEILGVRFLESKLKRMFDFRHEVTKRIVESASRSGECQGRHEASR